MSYINITDIVDVLRSIGFSALSPNADSSALMLHQCVSIAANEIEQLRKERRWIPVGESLPEPGKSVLVSTPQGICNAVYGDESGTDPYWMVFDFGEVEPTHWMPLPEPPAA